MSLPRYLLKSGSAPRNNFKLTHFKYGQNHTGIELALPATYTVVRFFCLVGPTLDYMMRSGSTELGVKIGAKIRSTDSRFTPMTDKSTITPRMVLVSIVRGSTEEVPLLILNN